MCTCPKHVEFLFFQINASNPQGHSTPVQVKQQYVTNKTVDDTLADKYMKEWKPTGRFQCKSVTYLKSNSNCKTRTRSVTNEAIVIRNRTMT